MKSLSLLGIVALMYFAVIKAAQFTIALFCILLFGSGTVTLVSEFVASCRSRNRGAAA
jgi:hypothetical protein